MSFWLVQSKHVATISIIWILLHSKNKKILGKYFSPKRFCMKVSDSTNTWLTMTRTGYKKGQHRSCHTAKCNLLNKWLKTTTTNRYWSLILSLSPPSTSNHDHFTHICTNISHTRTTTYAHMHICNPPPKSGKIKCCHLANIEYFLSLALFRLRLRVLQPGEYHVIHTPMPEFYRILYCVIISVTFCPPSWNLLSDLCQTSTANVRCHYA